jgi:hypothetical protein
VLAYRQPVTSFFQVQTFGGVYGLSVIIDLVVVAHPYLSASLRPTGLACKGPSTWHSLRLLRPRLVAGGGLSELCETAGAIFEGPTFVSASTISQR